MAASLTGAGLEVDAATTIDPSEARERKLPFAIPVPMGSWNCYYFPRQTRFYKCSLPLRSWLNHHVKDYALVHVHALFSFSSIAACRAARNAGVPYIVRPLGLLNRWGMQNRRRKVKALSFRLVERPLLNAAAAIHYTSTHEQQEAAALDLKTPGVVIPLGIDTSAFQHLPARSTFEELHPQAKDRQLILFLSRIDPKKGLEVLFHALQKLVKSCPKALLVVAGSGDEHYITQLRTLADRLGIGEHVLWVGFLGYEDKRAAFGAADVFVLPSRSENFGIALLEAMAAGVASVSTAGVALGDEASEAGAVQLAAYDADSLTTVIARLLNSEEMRTKLGRSGQSFASARYSLETMGVNLATVYKELVR
jgi:glycosyltransferase involved in cell wall biosynthesis